jgi:hypothetical protein
MLLLNDYQVFFGIPVSRVGKALGQFRRGAIGLIRVSTPPSAKKGTRTTPGYNATVRYCTRTHGGPLEHGNRQVQAACPPINA